MSRIVLLDAGPLGMITHPKQNSEMALDADVILAAQAFVTRQDGDDVIVATTNVGHLSLFVSAKLWHEIPYFDKTSVEFTV